MLNPFGNVFLEITEDMDIVANKIIVGPQVYIETGVTLTLTATEEIIFDHTNGGQNSSNSSNSIIVDPGAAVSCVIDPDACLEQLNDTPVNSIQVSTNEGVLEVNKNNTSEKLIGFDKNHIEERKDFTVSVFPNPSSDGNFNVKIEGLTNSNEMLVVELIDVVGNKVFSKIVQETEFISFNISTQVKGVYFLKVLKGKQTKVEKVTFH